jgi:hypothetical protein
VLVVRVLHGSQDVRPHLGYQRSAVIVARRAVESH